HRRLSRGCLRCRGGASARPAGRAKREPAMRVSAPLEHLQRRLAQAWRERAVMLKAASFALVGVVNTTIDYGIFLAGYYLLNLPLVPANLLACLFAFSGSYWLNSYFTFP